jgi:hypothetical protein
MKGSVLPTTLLCASLGVALLWIAGRVSRRNSALVLKVVSSWLLAIATLLAVLQCLPVTPGYLPDHVE